jgi:hypothetical protein
MAMYVPVSDRPQPSGIASTELQRISDRLAALQKRLLDHYGIDTLYVGAGSALAILDHCLEGKALVMRDLDVFICLGEEMTAAKAFEMGPVLAGEDTGAFFEHDVRPRRRGNPRLPVPAALEYNTGFGLFLIDESGEVLDLTVFHSRDDMMLNGIMNVDMVRIPLTTGETLVEKLQPLTCGNTCCPRDTGVEDEFGGYASWQNCTAELVNEFDLQRAPLQTILRVIRTFAKFPNPRISEETRMQLRQALARDADGNCAFYTVRNLIKVMNDRNATWELDLLREIGGERKVGGAAREQLQRIYRMLDRFGHRSREVEQTLRQAIAELSGVEHQMKLQGVV